MKFTEVGDTLYLQNLKTSYIPSESVWTQTWNWQNYTCVGNSAFQKNGSREVKKLSMPLSGCFSSCFPWCWTGSHWLPGKDLGVTLLVTLFAQELIDGINGRFLCLTSAVRCLCSKLIPGKFRPLIPVSVGICTVTVDKLSSSLLLRS